MFKHTAAPVFGPTKRSKLDLMGIRFIDEGGDGSGAGGDGAAELTSLTEAVNVEGAQSRGSSSG